MPKTIQPSIRQKTAFEKTLKNIAQNRPVVMGKIMMESGYSKASSINPYKNLISKDGWAELKAKYADDEKALKTLSDLSAEENEDKDNRLKASVEILKLNDRYPAQKSKVLGLFQGLDSLEE